MKKLFPLDPRRTLVTHLFAPRSAAEAIAEARNAEADGAEAVAVEWKLMPGEFRNAETYRAVIGSVPLPFMFLIYRNDMLGWSDEKHAEMLLDASRAGVGMIDVMGDLFSPAPDERTLDPGAIRRQKELIGELHALGSQVIVSSHPVRPMSSGEVLAQLLDFEERGADVVKIVTKADTEEGVFRVSPGDIAGAERAETRRVRPPLRRQIRPFPTDDGDLPRHGDHFRRPPLSRFLLR